MNRLPFDQPGSFYKGNLHTHSTVSDGHLSPEAVCEVYRRAGYDFLALTDHFLEQFNFEITDTSSFRTDTFTTIIGAELHTGMTEFNQLWHILAVGLPLDFASPQPGETGPQIAQRALDMGAYVAAAHPNWYSVTQADVLSLGKIHAVEIFNATAYSHNDRADSWHLLDILSAGGNRYLACATDDAHFEPNREDVHMGWVQVKVESLEPDALLTALKAGHYYSSTGPAIYDVELTPGDKVVVTCSPADRIYVTGLASRAVSLRGEGMLGGELSLQNFSSPFARITVRDRHGKAAWTNPFWFE